MYLRRLCSRWNSNRDNWLIWKDMENEGQAFLGRGWAFPPGFSLESGRCNMVQGDEDIRQALMILLSTRLGERVMQMEFGSTLHTMMFEKADKSMLTFLKDNIETAILYHEPRIRLVEIKVLDNELAEGRIHIDIIYVVRSTNTRSNLVYPFYLNEATDIMM
jgi:uncharacterized protein